MKTFTLTLLSFLAGIITTMLVKGVIDWHPAMLSAMTLSAVMLVLCLQFVNMAMVVYVAHLVSEKKKEGRK